MRDEPRASPEPRDARGPVSLSPSARERRATPGSAIARASGVAPHHSISGPQGRYHERFPTSIFKSKARSRRCPPPSPDSLDASRQGDAAGAASRADVLSGLRRAAFRGAQGGSELATRWIRRDARMLMPSRGAARVSRGRRGRGNARSARDGDYGAVRRRAGVRRFPIRPGAAGLVRGAHAMVFGSPGTGRSAGSRFCAPRRR